MTSRRTSSVTPGSATIVFLDANILAKPVTRTLLMVGGMPSGFHVLWSETAEREAARHLRLRAVTHSDVRRRFEIPLGPTGDIAGRFASTKGNDRQILADADAARARFLVTEDVDDFAEADLIGLGLSAVNPDLFLAERLTRDAYALVIDLFVERQVAPPTTAAQFHSAVARQHPRLFAAHADLHNVGPATSVHREPAVIFRGTRCLSCETIVAQPGELIDGLCADCRRARDRA
jgi:hypothetical protein